MRQKQTLNESQKKRIIKWDIPHLLCLLENQYSFSVVHLMTPAFFSKDGWLVFNGKTGFPLLMEKDFFGVLIILQALEGEQARSIRDFIDSYFRDLFLYRNQMNIHSKTRFSSKEDKKLSTDRFPLLLQRKKRESLLREAHDIYLQTPAFAFLNTEDFKWEEGVFEEMEDIFLCVPSFSRLSLFQKKLLIQSLLKKELPGPLVVGIHKEDDLPLKWQKLFQAIL